MEQQVKDKVRFRQILTVAKRDPEALDLWHKAMTSSTFEYRREWLRQYDKHVATIMEKLEPRLKTTIDTWERIQETRHGQQLVQPTIPLGDLQSASQ
jgi:hypothetical protein